MLYIREDKNGVIFKVWISFKAKKNQLAGIILNKAQYIRI